MTRVEVFIQRRRRMLAWASLVLLSLLLIWMIRYDPTPYLRGPAPFPEWRWSYYFKPTLPRLWPLGLCAPGLLLLLALTARRACAARRCTRLLLLLALPLGVGWQLALCNLEVHGATATLVARMANPLFSSYLHAADLPAARNPRAFLSDYRSLQPELARWAPHAATHPPTATLFFRGGITLCEQTPALRRLLLARITAAGVDSSRFRPHLSPAALAASLLLSWVLLTLSAATAWPLYLMAKHLHGDRRAATRVGILWLLLPGPTLMVPELDPALALPVALFGAGLAAAWLKPSGDAPWRLLQGATAGAGAGAALLLSYGAPTFLLITGLGLLAARSRIPQRARMPHWLPPLLLATAVALRLVWLPALWGAEPLAQAREALRIHRAGFTAPRSYLLWLLFNPVDLLLFLGPPVCIAAAVGLGAPRRTRTEHRFAWGWGGALLLLLLSGVLRGEMGRIAIPLMPAALLACLPRPRWSDATLIALLCALTALTLRLAWQLP